MTYDPPYRKKRVDMQKCHSYRSINKPVVFKLSTGVIRFGLSYALKNCCNFQNRNFQILFMNSLVYIVQFLIHGYNFFCDKLFFKVKFI